MRVAAASGTMDEVPELPDIELYLASLRRTVEGQALERIRVLGPSVLRSVEPDLDAFVGRTLEQVSRRGKRIVFSFAGDLHLVIHLMIAGRLRFGPPRDVRKRPGPIVQAECVFTSGMLTLTEASTEKRATITAVLGMPSVAALDPGGIDPIECDRSAFAAALRKENRTLKRALTDPATISGIGNAYSDEILCVAGLSPATLTSRLDEASCDRLREATRTTLLEWTRRLVAEFADRFPGPGDVTAFRPDFLVHGKFGKPCGVCATRVERIVRGAHETNYCPRCQTGGKILADRSLSRLLKDDWPGIEAR